MCGSRDSFGDSDMNEGSIGSMVQLGITESYKLKRQVVVSASEAAEMILRYVGYCSLSSLKLTKSFIQGG